MHRQLLIVPVLASLTLLASPAPAAPAEFNPVAHQGAQDAGTLNVIVKLRKDGAGATIAKLSTSTDRTAALSKRSGLALGLRREISDFMLASTIELGDSSPAQALERLRA